MKKLLTLFFLSFFFTQGWAQSQCIEGNCINGQGTLIYASGTEKYIGEFRDGKRHGQGQYIDDNYPSFIMYFGGWEDGKKNGLGVLRERGSINAINEIRRGTSYFGSVYVGEWKDDKREGLGTQQITMGKLSNILGCESNQCIMEDHIEKQPRGTMPFREYNQASYDRYAAMLFGDPSPYYRGDGICVEYQGPWKADVEDDQGSLKVFDDESNCSLVPDGWPPELGYILGFNFEDVDLEIAQLYELENPSAARITSTSRGRGRLAQRSGLSVGDIILEVGDTEVRDSSGLRLLLSHLYGMEPEITIYRDGEYLTLSLPPPLPPNSPMIHYEGGFKEGFYNGRGSYADYIHDSEREYNGDFVNGAFHGQGTLVYETGEIYSGDWVNGYRHGQGTYTYTDGYTYGGEWVQGRYLLDGEYIDDFREFARQEAQAARQEAAIARAAEERYFQLKAAGRCIEGDCTNGQGTFVYSNGRTIVGEWKNGKRHGSVTMSYPNGSSYTGRWWNGNWCGEALSC